MSKSTNPTFIGAFVIGSMTLLFLAIALFSSMTFFTPTSKVVILFEDSVSGLNVGAHVVFHGVPIGTVTKVTLAKNISEQADNIGIQNIVAPVYVTFKKVGASLVDNGDNMSMQAHLNALFARGLRARLAPQSLLTGQLMIELDFFPREELPTIITSLPLYNDTPQIPAVPSRLESIWRRIDTIPFNTIAKNIQKSAEELEKMLHSVNDLKLIEKVYNTVDGVQETSTALKTLTDNAQITITNLNNMTHSLQTQFPALQNKTEQLLNTSTNTMEEANALITSLQHSLNPTSTTIVSLQKTLYEMSEAARAVRSLATALERQPEMLLRGRTLQP